jgi:hypothetical protein
VGASTSNARALTRIEAGDKAPDAMRRSRTLAVALLFAVACAPRARRPGLDNSGFLDDYSVLQPGSEGGFALVYRNPKAQWTSYDKVLLEPVTLWRSGKQSLDPVPEGDLLRLIADLEAAVRRRLGTEFKLVDEPAPGTMIVRLAITEARAADPILDVLRGHGRDDVTKGMGPLHDETRRFIENAEIEGEIRDARTNELLAAGVDQRRAGAPAITTWADLDHAVEAWAKRVFAPLELRTRGTR